jgi:hypothetical protein
MSVNVSPSLSLTIPITITGPDQIELHTSSYPQPTEGFQKIQNPHPKIPIPKFQNTKIRKFENLKIRLLLGSIDLCLRWEELSPAQPLSTSIVRRQVSHVCEPLRSPVSQALCRKLRKSRGVKRSFYHRITQGRKLAVCLSTFPRTKTNNPGASPADEGLSKPQHLAASRCHAQSIKRFICYHPSLVTHTPDHHVGQSYRSCRETIASGSVVRSSHDRPKSFPVPIVVATTL